MESQPLGFEYIKDRNVLNLFTKDPTIVMELRTMKNIQFGNSKTDQNFCNPKYYASNVEYDVTGEFADKRVTVQVAPSFTGLYSMKVVFTLIKDNLLNVDFHLQKNITEFEIPYVVLNSTLYPIKTTYAKGKIQSYLTLPKVGDEFYFEVHSKDKPSDLLYSTKGQHLIYSELYKEINAKLYASSRIFGLGERIGDFWLQAGTYTVWNRGPAVQEREDGQTPGKNLYGTHPVFFAQKKTSSDFFAVYHHNTGPQDFVFQATASGTEINVISTSGRSNLFFLMDDKIANVVKNFYDLVGKPMLPPEWGLGWHQSRFGYNSTQALQDVYDGYKNKSFPLDAIWSDVDYLDDFRDFTIDKENFKGLKEFVDKIKTNGTRYVPIIGAGISAGDSEAYFDGIKADVFIKSSIDKSDPLIGRSTPGECVFVDFFMHNSIPYWQDQMETLHQMVAFDGVWLDMNEISNYCDGYCYIDQKAKNPIDNKLFYWPGGRDLERGTISLDAVHENGALELDTHSAYGLLESYATASWFKKKTLRPFVMSRSTFSGSGKYAGHWTGDNYAEYDWLSYSVHNIYQFNFFGVPFTGADICGYNGNTTASLCTKWYKLSVIYPFARNHNSLETNSQEPYVDTFNRTIDYTYDKTAQDVMKKAFLTRYGLHVYTYTQFHKASTDGIPVVRPLFYDYPEDTNAYDSVANNIMLGGSIKASPDYSYSSRYTFYFPERGSKWCPIWEGVYYQCFTGGSFQNIPVPISEILLHFKSGSIIPIQLSDSTKFDKIKDIGSLDDLAQKYKTDLAVLLNEDNNAKGDVRFDGGVTTLIEQYDEIQFSAVADKPLFGNLNMDITFNLTKKTSIAPQTNSQMLGDVIIYDAEELGFYGGTIGTIETVSGDKIALKGEFNSVRKTCRLKHDGAKPTLFKDIVKIHIELPDEASRQSQQ
uniref:Alpha-glucosidase n=1 Tax=Euplotes harpa TaxID=151035 RepID=A0A7S3NAI4_9SPIT|mmetsp:Transcript_40453/g.46407  ORF Transcript_40453/g.46407 Transcript_40453/m.46407 type:complete len:930 (+) Transcript_40453:424-3213(+)